MKMKEIEQNRNDENKIKMESRQEESVKNLQNNEPSRRRRQCRKQLDKIKTNIVGAAREVQSAKKIDKTCKVKNNGVERMTYNRVVKIAREKTPNGRRSTGRSRKRWSDDDD
jgi:hypothetical protein